MKNKETTSIITLGGLGEVGKNMYIFSHKEELIIIDAGVKFPESELMGVDYVIQDVTYLKQNEDRIKALIITHGHEDHIGGITFLIQNVNIPVIHAPRMASHLIKIKLANNNLKYENIETYDEDTILEFKHFKFEFVTTTHSVPDSYAIAVTTPNGIIFESGDFKFDLTPIGPMANITKMAEIGSRGVKLLLSDSTNALSKGFSKSESVVDEQLNDIIRSHHGRIIIATFASNVYRVKHIVETCKKYNRSIVTFGRSMINIIDIALENGIISDKSIFIDANKAKTMKKNEVCILCTGSQGEPLAALTRIASGAHKQISLMGDDLVIFSSKPIPGNAASVSRVINQLYLKGVKVYTNNEYNDIHTSGHGNQEELKLLLRLIQPEFFMPMHGEHRMLIAHKELAIDCDVKEENVFICQNGDVLEMSLNSIALGTPVTAGDVYVDGSRIGDIGSVVIKDRKLMSKDGILLTILNINPMTKKLLIKPNVTTRGFILVNENTGLINQIEKKVTEIVNKYLQLKPYSYTDLKNAIILELHPFIRELTGRHPIVLPVIMEVKEQN